MKSTTILCLLLATGATLLTSCQDEEFGYSTKEVQDGLYARNFTDMFGAVDPNHTWSTADQLKLNVDIKFEGEYTVKVYTANPRYPENNAYLVGEYQEMGTGKHTLQCDMPATVECAYVGLIDAQGNRMILPAEIEQHTASVTFGGETPTRATYSGTTPFGYGATASKIITTIDDIKTPLQTLPEHVNNTGKVTQNFEYISLGEFDIYPIYSITSNSGGRYKYNQSEEEKNRLFGERLGIYTYDNGGNIQKDENGEIKVTWIWHMNRGVLSDDKSSVVTGSWFEGHKSGESDDNWHQMYWFENNISGTDEEKAAREPFCAWKGSNFANGYDKIRTDGIHLSIATGLRFGFVLDTDHGYVYSNSAYNLDEGGTKYNDTTPDHVKDTYAATFHTNNSLYLAFEDYGYNVKNHDNDFNDLVMKLVPSNGSNNPLIIDKDSEVDPIIYIVACEDLGGTFDWDFNDVVFGIEHVSGHNQARVKLMAAGGTLPISLQYCPDANTLTAITFANLLTNEGTTTSLHAAMGADDDTPINVIDGGHQSAAVYSEYFDVDRYAFTVLDDAKKFKINVTYSDGTSQREIQMPDKAGTSKVPQAFLIADPNWQWPSEGQNIVSKYSEFQNWVENSLSGNNWTHTVWGIVREYNTIPSYSTSLLNFDGAVSFQGNKAIITLDKNYMTANCSYKLAVMVTEDADALFQFASDGSTIIDAPNGSILGDHLTTFSLSGEVINAIRNSGANGKLTLTFAEGKNASDCVKLVNWYKDGEKLPSCIEIESSFDIFINQPIALPYTTRNQESPVVITSDDTNVVRVNDDGTIVGIAAANGITIRLTQEASEHYAREEKLVTINVLSYYAPIDMPNDHFHIWSGAGKNAVILNINGGSTMTLNTNTTNLVFGNGNVKALQYIDLSNSDVLVATTTSGEPRLLFNRPTDSGTISVELPRDKSQGYETVIDNGDGSTSYIINLKKIREKDGFVHLHAIKPANTSSGVTVTSIKLDKFECTNHWNNDSGELTHYNYCRYKADGYYSANPIYESDASKGSNDNVIYGDNGPSAYTFKIMDTYNVLKITYTGSDPRFFFNRQYVYDSSKGYETGEALDIADYKTTATDNGKKIIYINLAAIKRDKGFVHLNGIKKDWDGTTAVDGVMNLLY